MTDVACSLCGNPGPPTPGWGVVMNYAHFDQNGDSFVAEQDTEVHMACSSCVKKMLGPVLDFLESRRSKLREYMAELN